MVGPPGSSREWTGGRITRPDDLDTPAPDGTVFDRADPEPLPLTAGQLPQHGVGRRFERLGAA